MLGLNGGIRDDDYGQIDGERNRRKDIDDVGVIDGGDKR